MLKVSHLQRPAGRPPLQRTAFGRLTSRAGGHRGAPLPTATGVPPRFPPASPSFPLPAHPRLPPPPPLDEEHPRRAGEQCHVRTPIGGRWLVIALDLQRCAPVLNAPQFDHQRCRADAGNTGIRRQRAMIGSIIYTLQGMGDDRLWVIFAIMPTRTMRGSRDPE
jgi:hypothetical protein